MKTLFVALLLAAVPGMAADIYDFTLLPQNGAIQGVPGSTIGWGYTINNESTSLWLVTTDLSAGTFQHATPDLLFDFPDLAPGASVTVPYNPNKAAGLYGIVWDANTPMGFVNSGSFSINAEWWNGDPAAGGQFRFAAPDSAQPYAASVASVATPEPGTLVLLSLPLLASCLLGLRRNRVPTSLKP